MNNKLNPTQRKGLGFDKPWQPRIKEANEALPNQINKMSGVYVPTQFNIRSGGEDHLKYKSRGV